MSPDGGGASDVGAVWLGAVDRANLVEQRRNVVQRNAGTYSSEAIQPMIRWQCCDNRTGFLAVRIEARKQRCGA